MTVGLPKSQFIGIDLSKHSLLDGTKDISAILDLLVTQVKTGKLNIQPTFRSIHVDLID